MALINSIREKTGMAVGVIAVGLLLFLVGGDLLAPNSRLLGSDDRSIGEINGNSISAEEYQNELEKVKYNFTLNSGKPPTEDEMQSVREQAWNNLVFQYAYGPELDDLGVKVTEAELVDMVQGNTISPAIRNTFANPETGEFDRNLVVNFLQTLDQREPQVQASWYAFEQQLGPARLNSKYMNLLKKGAYVTKAEVERDQINKNAKAKVKYLYVPFYAIADSTISVTDGELMDYMEKHKANYENEATRDIRYVTFPIKANRADSTYYLDELNKLKSSYADAENDSAFTRLNSDLFTPPTFVSVADLPADLKDRNDLEAGMVYGPFVSGNTIKVYKLGKPETDTIAAARASHILIKPEGESEEDLAKAKQEAERIIKEIKGGASFAAMASQYGTDGTKDRGGDLGWFTTGRMVAPFEEAVFAKTDRGLIQKPVKTDFGYHVIEVTEPKTNKGFTLSAVEREVMASDETRNASFQMADRFAGTTSSTAEFEAMAKEQGLQILEAPKLTSTANRVNNITSARPLVRWAFADANLDQVSDVMEINDQYVVATLVGKKDENELVVDAFRDELTQKVRMEKKAEQILEKLKDASGSLEEMAKVYPNVAQVNTADGLSLQQPSIQGIGQEPAVVGRAFGLSQGAVSKPFQGETGVFVVQLESLTPAAEMGNVADLRKQLAQTKASRYDFYVNEALKSIRGIEDRRYKFY